MQLKTLKSGGKKPAIVTDIDETLLDNSPAFAKDMFGTRNSEVVWQEWIASGKADAKAGALKFLMYAQSKGVEVFYITNRSTDEKALTLKALQMLRVPNADSLHLFMKTDTWNKEPRRMEVAKKYNILLLIGDNLNDFSEAFFFKSPLERRLAVDSLRREFGSCFIVLPNPMDGNWESALYGYEKGLSETVKAQKRYEALKSY
jgi:5'-nucleotidase (lipoprotein e(P4) family)